MVRSVTPMISAASHQVIFLAIAFNSTSFSLNIRSTSAAVYWHSGSTLPACTGQYPKRTDHVLIRPDRSHANDMFPNGRIAGKATGCILAPGRVPKWRSRCGCKFWVEALGETGARNETIRCTLTATGSQDWK